MASPNNFDFPYFPPPPPPPPPHVKPPPSPPNVRPPPPALPPAPSPSSTSTTIILIVFVSFGGLFFLAFLACGICCLIKKRKKKVEKTEVIRVDEHLKVKEAIVDGPHGPHAVLLEIEDDIHVDEVIKKEEKFGEGLHNNNSNNNNDDKYAKNKSLEIIEALPSSSTPNTHPQLENNA